jgi:hypothetical protein
MSHTLNYAFSLCYAFFAFLFQNDITKEVSTSHWYIIKMMEGVYVNLLIVFPILIFVVWFVFSLFLDMTLLRGRYFVRPAAFLMGKFSSDFGNSIHHLVEHLREEMDPKRGLLKTIIIDRRKAFAEWMKEDFTKNYENNVEGFAYWGAGVLIFLIGLRGIKFITAEDPSWIIFGLELECMMLILLGITKFYTPEFEVEEEKPEGVPEGKELVSVSYDAKLVIELIQSLKIFVEQFGEQQVKRYLTVESKDQLLRKINSLKIDIEELKVKFGDATEEDSYGDKDQD